MQVDWDVAIRVDDGLELRADVFRPAAAGRNPVILTYGPYAKGLAFQDGYPSAWQRMVAEHPDVAAGSSNLYQSWEVVDPEKWVPEGGVQPSSRGKVGLNGVSYFGTQWHVASLQPPHLAAICVWEGMADWYRDGTHHGGAHPLSNFKNELRGCGPFLHDDPRERPPEVFAGRTALHLDNAYFLLPVIP
ncbi:MAG: CocE/NonD family hydrolase [Betaproteobacteria bacterium]